VHLALLGVVVLVGLVMFAVVRIRHRREAAEAAEAETMDSAPDEGTGVPDDR
jgi:flagellar biosynthesis/type III secretory pathway M-ring protein FliF/YscJ